MIKHWIELINLDETFILWKTDFMLKRDVDNNIWYGDTNWAFQIKTILDSLGLCIHLASLTENPFELIKQCIFDLFYQNWYADIIYFNRLLLYSRYKHDFSFAKYLDFITDKKLRISFSLFQLSLLYLATEQGRYNNTPWNERICKFCNLSSTFYWYAPYTEILGEKNYLCNWPIGDWVKKRSQFNQEIIPALLWAIIWRPITRRPTCILADVIIDH